MIKIEHLKEEQIQAAHEIEKLSFAAPKDISVFESDKNKYWVVKEDAKILGFIGVEEIKKKKLKRLAGLTKSKKEENKKKKCNKSSLNEHVFI